MEASLDFIKRTRRAWAEFRHPSTLGALENQNEGDDYNADPTHKTRRTSAYPARAGQVLDPLTEFRMLVGIDQDPSFQAPNGFQANRRAQTTVGTRPAPNMGIYTTVCDAEVKYKRNFKSTSRMINICLGLQIIVAAALTALGASNGSHNAVTAFGAINTIIAALMSYLKGSGLPNRLKYFQHEFHKVREYIEQCERDLLLGHDRVVQNEIRIIRDMFEIVKADIETNTPDRFVSATTLRQQQNSTVPGVNLTRPQPSFSTDSFGGRRWNEKEAEAHGALSKAQGSVPGMFSTLGHFKEAMEDKVKDLGHMEKDIESNGRHMVDEKKHSLANRIQTTIREVADVGKEIQEKARAAASHQTQQFADSGRQAQQQVGDAYHQATDNARQAQQYAGDAYHYGADNARQAQRYAGDAIHQSTDAAWDAQRRAEDSMHHVSDAARQRISDTADTAVADINQTREATRAGLVEQRDALNRALSDTADTAVAGINQTREATRAGLAEQRDALNRSLSDQPPHDGDVPPRST